VNIVTTSKTHNDLQGHAFMSLILTVKSAYNISN